MIFTPIAFFLQPLLNRRVPKLTKKRCSNGFRSQVYVHASHTSYTYVYSLYTHWETHLPYNRIIKYIYITNRKDILTSISSPSKIKSIRRNNINIQRVEQFNTE